MMHAYSSFMLPSSASFREFVSTYVFIELERIQNPCITIDWETSLHNILMLRNSNHHSIFSAMASQLIQCCGICLTMPDSTIEIGATPCIRLFEVISSSNSRMESELQFVFRFQGKRLQAPTLLFFSLLSLSLSRPIRLLSPPPILSLHFLHFFSLISNRIIDLNSTIQFQRYSYPESSRRYTKLKPFSFFSSFHCASVHYFPFSLDLIRNDLPYLDLLRFS
ncbi:hypothetical protein RIF29_30114 [Crotalaria pallida]|uniref:Uncharacterized protein n=1 Tax=Crotalaria pallida TaxID=3830 RepID=A0AAN9HY20_CROPI